MNPPDGDTFLLRWKGVESGPFSVPEIRERLADGEISRMHQVQVNGSWKLLDDFLEMHSSEEREAASRREFDAHPADERSRFAQNDARPADSEKPEFERPVTTRTSGLAVAALVAGLGCFIPYVRLVSWIPALACGHIALMQIKHDASLGGRWLAAVGLVVAYFSIVMGLTYAALMIYHGRSLF